MRFTTTIVFTALIAAGCRGPEQPGIEDLKGGHDFALFRLVSLRGARDGDSLRTLATFSDSSSILQLELLFAVGSPTKLTSGSWHLVKGSHATGGTVAARSVTFLGGQTVLPSIGGTFDLNEDGAARYRVTLPARQLDPLPTPGKNWLEVKPWRNGNLVFGAASERRIAPFPSRARQEAVLWDYLKPLPCGRGSVWVRIATARVNI